MVKLLKTTVILLTRHSRATGGELLINSFEKTMLQSVGDNPANIENRFKVFEKMVTESSLSDNGRMILFIMADDAKSGLQYWNNGNHIGYKSLGCLLSSDPIGCLCRVACKATHKFLGISFMDPICCFYL